MADELAGALGENLGDGWDIECAHLRAVATFKAEAETVAALATTIEGDCLVARLQIAGWPEYDSAQARSLIDGLVRSAVRCGTITVRLDSTDLLARNEARLSGFEGGTRQALTRRIDPGHQHNSRAEPTSSWAVSTIETLLGQSSVRAIWPKSPMRRIIQRAVSGSGSQIQLIVGMPCGRFDVWVPEREDLMPEPIAMAADTAMAIKARFGPALRHVASLRFDLAHHGMSKNRVAGAANMEFPAIHINAGLCCADLAVQNEVRRRGWKPKRPSAQTEARFRVEKVVAHEVGHQLDNGFQGSRYRESMEFRRRLGECLGVPSIEFAVRGTWDADQEAAQRAKALLREHVSPYATTNLHEAMAELFAVWWFAGSERTPIIEAYDGLIEEFFPPTVA